DAAIVDGWLEDLGIGVPSTLRQLWIVTGGGVLFETEEVLGPHSEPPAYLTVSPVPALVFHEGFVQSGVTPTTGEFVICSRVGQLKRVRSLAAWYLALRDEFAERYGLPAMGSA